MTYDAANSDGNRDEGNPDDVAFRAAVDAAFGDPPADGAPVADSAVVAELRALLVAMAESSLDVPTAALRERVLSLLPGRAGLVERFVRDARRIAMELLTPPPKQALAGFRVADVPVRTYRTAADSTVEAWLDVQVDRESASADGRRIRGQVSIEPGDATTPAPVAVHALDAASGQLVHSAAVDEHGAFAMRLDVPKVDLLVELDTGDGALSVPAITLRTDVP
ncbi:MAG: hypothetical protein U0572_14175 [Phycisphaerales bacterium]